MHLKRVPQNLDIPTFGRPPDLFIVANEYRPPDSLNRNAPISIGSYHILILIDEGVKILKSLDNLISKLAKRTPSVRIEFNLPADSILKFCLDHPWSFRPLSQVYYHPCQELQRAKL